MANLSDIMINKDLNLLNQIYREPSITAYNRLEPRPRSQNFDQSLRAEVRDPLWFLTRQWQMGELESEDCGSAIDARLVTKKTHIDRIALQGNRGKAYNEEIPMETLVEREIIPFTTALKIQVSQYFLRLHSTVLKEKYLPQYAAEYAFPLGIEDTFKGQEDGLNLYMATKKRALDGSKIFKDIKDGTLKAKITIEVADVPAIDEIITQLENWFSRQYSQPKNQSDSAWNSRQLNYSFSIAATESNGAQAVLRAGHYHHGRLDWYNFDSEVNPQNLTTDSPDTAARPEEKETVSFIPTATAFKGMPNARFWEMEEREINFGTLNAKTTDHLMLILAEFGLVYGNDWFVIPYKMPVNTLCEIKGLVVTDVFGDRTLVQAAGEGESSEWQRWSMFSFSTKNNMGQYNRQFFLPSTLQQTLESEPVEQVSFIRDEMANLVWGIEEVIPDATNKGIDGHEAADKTEITPPPVTGSTAAIRYVLGTTVPENWIPFIPVHKPGSVQDINFQRASMPKSGVPPTEVIKAKGVLLNEVPAPYYINEEEIPYSGTIISRSCQRVRWYNGKTYIWIGRYRENGRGQGNSNLKFDQIEHLNK